MDKSNTIFNLGVLLFLAFVAFIAYQGLVAIPRAEIEAKERQAELERLEAQRVELDRDRKLTACKLDAYANYTADWNGQCKILGKEPECTMPRYLAETFDESHEKDVNDCITLYKN